MVTELVLFACMKEFVSMLLLKEVFLIHLKRIVDASDKLAGLKAETLNMKNYSTKSS